LTPDFPKRIITAIQKEYAPQALIEKDAPDGSIRRKTAPKSSELLLKKTTDY
jgi:hypothetical protein